MSYSSNVQQEYKNRKLSQGFKRVQIWRLDETNKDVRQRIEYACKKINQQDNGQDLLKEIATYTHDLLQDTPL